MRKFLELNRWKLRFAFTTTSLILLVPLSIIWIVAYINESLPDLQLLVIMLFTAGFALPGFILLLGYLTWLHKSITRKKALSKIPFNQIENLGFYKSLINDQTKWHLTEEIKQGMINGFILRFDIAPDKSHVIQVEAPVEWQQIDKRKYNRLSKKFKRFNIEFRIGSLVKQYNTRRINVRSIAELQKDLEQFTEILEIEGFRPKKSFRPKKEKDG
jgi:hypothetical protein